METYGSIVDLLEQCNLSKTAKALRDDLEQDITHFKGDPRLAKDLFKMMKKVVTVKESQEVKGKSRETQPFDRKKPTAKASTPEETENIMEGFLNKLMGKPALLATDRINPKMEKFLNASTFQKMYDSTTVLQDMSNLSAGRPQPNKPIPSERKQEAKIDVTETSWDHDLDNAPHFVNPDLSAVEDQPISQKIQPQAQKSKNPNYIDLKSESNGPKKSPSVEVLFDNERDEFTPLQKQNTKESFERSVTKSEIPGLTMIHHQEDPNDFSVNRSFNFGILEDPYQNAVDDYTDDDDPGFDLYEVAERDFVSVAKQLADKYDFPARASVPDPDKDNKQDKDTERNRNQFTPTDDSGLILQELKNKKEGKGDDTSSRNTDLTARGEKDKKPKGYIHLPPHLKHPPSNDNFYPVVFENVIYDCFTMKVIYDRERTGFEETKDFPIVINSIVGGKYQILQYLGSAAFSKAIECLDMTTQQRVCMKVIENNKDYFDQSVDEIKLLKFINHNADVDEKCVLRFYDFFYHKEHLFIVTELLKENLYEFSKLNREREKEPYFTIGRLQRITKQILTALDYIHSLNLIHCDLKPENILLKDYENADIKVIDFGSSCFIHDHLSSYVQSRSYRAPEVIIGCKYDFKIDMWSLGCILAELWTGNVLFQNDTVQGLLARVIGIIGAFPESMLKNGRLVPNFFTKEKLLYQEATEEGDSHAMTDNSEVMTRKRGKTGKVQILVPKRSSLKHRLRTNDLYFLDFVRGLLEIDPAKRPTARDAMNHPWITECRYQDPPYGGKRS